MQFPVTPHRPLSHTLKYGSVVTLLPPFTSYQELFFYVAETRLELVT